MSFAAWLLGQPLFVRVSDQRLCRDAYGFVQSVPVAELLACLQRRVVPMGLNSNF